MSFAVIFFFYVYGDQRERHCFHPRRSSDSKKLVFRGFIKVEKKGGKRGKSAKSATLYKRGTFREKKKKKLRVASRRNYTTRICDFITNILYNLIARDDNSKKDKNNTTQFAQNSRKCALRAINKQYLTTETKAMSNTETVQLIRYVGWLNFLLLLVFFSLSSFVPFFFFFFFNFFVWHYRSLIFTIFLGPPEQPLIRLIMVCLIYTTPNSYNFY